MALVVGSRKAGGILAPALLRLDAPSWLTSSTPRNSPPFRDRRSLPRSLLSSQPSSRLAWRCLADSPSIGLPTRPHRLESTPSSAIVEHRLGLRNHAAGVEVDRFDASAAADDLAPRGVRASRATGPSVSAPAAQKTPSNNA